MRAAQIAGTVAAVGLGLTLTACGGQKDTASSPMPSMPTPGTMSMSMSAVPMAGAVTGTFNGLNGKRAMGTATVAGTTVNLTGFSSDQGPDLYLYLTNGPGEADVKSGIRLGAVGYDKATQTFMLPAGTAASAYRYVVVHCDKALAVFGAAQLTR